MAEAPISFARGAPSLDIIAVDDLRAAADRAFTVDAAGTFAYGTAVGYRPLSDGIDVDALEAALRGGRQPKLAHVIPNFQNPGGYTLSLEKRRKLLALAREHEFTIFEDD